MYNTIDVKQTLEKLTKQHKLQRESIGTIRKNSKKSAIWLLEGFSLALLNRAISQIDANDVVMYEIIAKVRLAQEANLMIMYLLSPEADQNATKAWGKALAYYIDAKDEIKYRQYRNSELYDEAQKFFFDTLSIWSHASYDNARTSFMYVNKSPGIYDLNYTLDNEIYNNNQWLSYIKDYTEKSFSEVNRSLFSTIEK